MTTPSEKFSPTNPYGGADFWKDILIRKGGVPAEQAERIARQWRDDGCPGPFLGWFAIKQNAVDPQLIKRELEKRLDELEQGETESASVDTSADIPPSENGTGAVIERASGEIDISGNDSADASDNKTDDTPDNVGLSPVLDISSAPAKQRRTATPDTAASDHDTADTRVVKQPKIVKRLRPSIGRGDTTHRKSVVRRNATAPSVAVRPDPDSSTERIGGGPFAGATDEDPSDMNAVAQLESPAVPVAPSPPARQASKAGITTDHFDPGDVDAWNFNRSGEDAPALSEPPPVGVKLGDVLLTRMLGQGGVAVVFQGFHLKWKKLVALKIFQPKRRDDKMDLERKRRGFHQEAMLLEKLDHDNIVRMLDFFQEAGHTVITLEFIDGMPISDILEFIGAMALPQTMRIFRDVCHALNYALSLGVIHRDIKPANLLLSREGRVKVSDFGLASVYSPFTGGGPVGNISGTPMYMSPEQTYPGSHLDHRSDMYSLGQTIFHMLTGHTPFDGADAGEFIRKQRAVPTPSLRSVMPNLPRSLTDIVDAMTAKDIDKRPFDYMEIVDVINALGF